MNLIHYLLLALVAIIALGLLTAGAATLGKKLGRQLACNTANVSTDGTATLKPGEAFATRFLIGTRGSSADEVDIAAAGELPLCVVADTADSDDVTNGEGVGVQYLGAVPGTVRMVGAGVIPDDTDVYSVGAGKVDIAADAASGDYLVGRSVKACAADGDAFEVIPVLPVTTKA